MFSATVGHGRPSLFVVTAEAIVAIILVATFAWVDRGSRSDGPESAVGGYVAAVAAGDLAGALDHVMPSERDRAASFVQWQLGNRYTITNSAVRSASLLDRLLGRASVPTQVVMTIEVNAEDGTHWRSTEDARVVLQDGRWYLARPLLQPQD